MSMSRFRLAAFGSALLLLAGCISVGGDRPSPGAGSSSQVGLRTAGYVPAAVSLGAETGTQVGRRVRQLQGELEQLQRSLSDHYTVLQTIRDDSVRIAQEYFGTVAAINARLQVGTTPGNPILISQWSEAHVQLEALSSDVTRLNNLAGQVAADSSLATFLLQNLRSTYALSGAVEEDHRQLGVLEDEINRTVVLIDRLLNELANDVNRQTSYLATERANLQTLQLGITNGQLYGGNLSNRVSGGGPAPLAAPPRPVTPVNIGPSAEQRPLVVIHMGNGPVDYQQQVYRAVSQALDHRPNATFDLVAVSPNAGSAAEIALAASSARSGADNVKRTLISMGLPAGRITVASAARNDVTGSEVRLYLR